MSTRLLEVFLNNQELNVAIEGVYGFYRGQDEVTIYKGNIIGKRLIIIEGKVYVSSQQQLIDLIEQFRENYSTETEIKIGNLTRTGVLKDIQILGRQVALTGETYIVALVFEEVV